MLSEIFKLFWKTVERKDARRINSQTPPTEIEQFCDIQYIDDGLWQHRLDVYSKSGKLSHRPVIIDIHGGGWMYGTKEINKNYWNLDYLYGLKYSLEYHLYYNILLLLNSYLVF